MANKQYNYYENNSICYMMIEGDGSHNTFKFTVSSELLESIEGGAPTRASVSIIQDSTGLGLTATAALNTALGVTTCTITFSQNLPASDPINGHWIQIQVTFEFDSQ